MTFKEKHGHCDVHFHPTGVYTSLAHWCNDLIVSFKKILNNQKPKIKLSDDSIQRLRA